MNQTKLIKVYRDAGVDKKTLPLFMQALEPYSKTFISAQQIKQTDWEHDTSLLLIPGGRDVPFHQALKGLGNQRIRAYVENGGSFFGICAGAYFGCGTVEFDCGRELEVKGKRELAFFPGIARGPAYGPGTFCYQSERGARASLISTHSEEHSIRTYYNGGCYFFEAEQYPDVTIISRYLEIENQPAAIVEMAIGKGKVILSGVHIERGSYHHPTLLNQTMEEMLQPFEEQRKKFFSSLLHRLL